MKRSHEQHFRVMSGIDDDILERTTEKRADLWIRRKRRIRLRRTLISSVATALVASILLFVFLPMLGSLDKQIPVYQGMSVSDTAVTARAESRITHSLSAEPLYAGGESDTVDIPEDLPEPPSDLSPRADMYFAAPGEDIYITVHIDNPDNFEILSFTLNGKKYSSYMFEEGSTMEALILKVNVGEREGFRDYTIDAIKYVDGESIKDVRMEGNRTIKIGVAADKNHPVASIETTSLTYTALSATVALPDVLGLVRDSGGVVLARLYHGEALTAVRVIDTPTEDTVDFSSLLPGEDYRLDIVAYYDACDGLGIQEYTVATATYKTPTPFRLTTEARRAAGSGWCYLYGSLTCDTAEASILSATYTKGTASEAVDVQEGFKIPHGEGTLTVTYRYKEKEYICVLPIRDGITAEELADYYTVTNPFVPYDEEDPSVAPPHLGIDLGSAQAGTYLAVYALSDGYGQWEGHDYIVYNSREITATCTRYRLTRISAALEEHGSSIAIKAGTFLGFVEVGAAAAQDTCTEGLHCHVSCYSAATADDKDPTTLFPFLQ